MTWFLAGAGVGAIVATLAVLLIRDSLPPVADVPPQPQAVTSLVGLSSTTERQLARIQPQWSEAKTLYAGKISGRITHLPTLDESLQTGDTAIEVDNIARPAIASGSPLWRNLDLADAGEDVLAVSRLLMELGLTTKEASRVDTELVSAVRDFESMYGWPKSGVFRPEYVVWLPVEPFEVELLMVDAGSFIEAESAIARGKRQLLSARVVSLAADSTLVLPYGPVVFEIPNTLTVPVSSDSSIIDETALQQLAIRLREELETSSALAEATQGVSFAGSIGVGVVRLAEPRELQTVPTAAILVSPDRTCVVSSDDQVFRVVVTGGVGGVTEIEPTLDPDVELIIEPTESEYSC